MVQAPVATIDNEQRLDLRRLLEAVEGAPPIDGVDVLASELATMVGATHVSLLIANFSGDAVVRLSHVEGRRARDDGLNERAESLPLAGSVYHQVLLTQESSVTRQGSHWLVLVPVTERGDAIGLLELSLPRRPTADTMGYLVSAAHALAYVLIASRRHTDVFEWAQRDVPFSLAAEIQRRLLPSAYTVEGGQFTLAGWLEPASHIGGDTFDYSLDREYLYASISDAMGHSSDAALLATLSVGSFRNTRRALASPAEQANVANRALLVDSRADQFVTAQLFRIRLADGHAELVNAGHPHPYLTRDGRTAQLAMDIEPALGVTDVEYHTQEFTLQAGDRLVFLTDGFLERNALEADLPAILTATAGRNPREVVRELADTVLRVTGGSLRDDATVMCLDWYGTSRARRAVGGATASRATASSARGRRRVPLRAGS